MSFFNRYAFFTLLFVTSFVGFEFFTQTHLSQSLVYGTESTVGAVAKPVGWGFSKIFSSIQKFYQNYFDLVDIRKKYAALEQDNVKLKVQLNVIQNLVRENQKLKDLLSFRNDYNFEFMLGKIIGYDPSLTFQSVKINLGKKDGIQPGMGAVAPAGVVGVIIRVQNRTSDLLLITDPNSNLDALITRNQTRGILQGKLAHRMQFKYFDGNTTIRKGDMLVTSGLTGAFPANMPIGVIANIQKNPNNLSQMVEVEPAVNVVQLTEILVLKQTDPTVELIQKFGGQNWIDHIMNIESGSENDDI